MPKKATRITAALKSRIDAVRCSGMAESLPDQGGRNTRIMYIERKAGAITGEARIGRVAFNRTRRTIFYQGHVFHRIVGGGFKSNYCDEATGEDYWISGCKRRGFDRLYDSNAPVWIDDDVREEYWRDIRRLPERVNDRTA